MSEVNNGIRFDIYERVHLPDNVAAIDELEEIELVPRIQVVDQGEHAVLQGQLVLNGIYRAQGSADEQVALEHWIPVEISLPMNRVTRLEEITVDIDTFDVVLLSSRTLNITGILSLRGISLEQEVDENVWSSEAFVATHDRSEEDEQYELQNDDQLEYRYEASDQEEANESAEEVEAEEESEQFFASYLQQEQEEEEFAAVERSESSEFAEAEQQEEEHEYIAEEETTHAYVERDEDESAYANAEEVQLSQSEAEQYTADSASYEQYEYEPYREEAESEQDEQYSQQDLQSEESEQEVLNQEREIQIALNGNTNQNETLGIRSILSSSLREQAAQQATLLQQETERQQEEAAKANVVDEAVEWQQLFLNNRPSQNEFRRIRMCIVQRADTLEEIAGRYNINPREILNANNLHESAITEGQLLYIP